MRITRIAPSPLAGSVPVNVWSVRALDGRLPKEAEAQRSPRPWPPSP